MRRTAFAALCLLLAAGFAALGVWQVERRAWKLDLIARVDARIHAPAQPLPKDWTGDLAYLRVRAAGTWVPGRDTLVQAVTGLGGGWWVLTPLVTPGGTILVNRGFIPSEQRESAAWRVTRPGPPVVVTGLLRASEPGGAFLRHNDPVANRWYSRDVAAIAQARGLGATAPLFIDADANPAGSPVGGLTVVSFPNNHLVYALTWFALAGLSGLGALRLIRGERVR